MPADTWRNLVLLIQPPLDNTALIRMTNPSPPPLRGKDLILPNKNTPPVVLKRTTHEGRKRRRRRRRERLTLCSLGSSSVLLNRVKRLWMAVENTRLRVAKHRQLGRLAFFEGKTGIVSTFCFCARHSVRLAWMGTLFSNGVHSQHCKCIPCFKLVERIACYVRTRCSNINLYRVDLKFYSVIGCCLSFFKIWISLKFIKIKWVWILLRVQ